MTICTDRLRLRPWRDADVDPFALLNADPRVMEYYPKTLNRAESDVAATRMRAFLAERGFGLWAVEVPGLASFAGYIGLAEPAFEAHFTPCIEIGWRLAFEHWSRGYATEGAKAVAADAFSRLGLAEIISFTVPENHRSRRVMEKLGMRRSEKDDFEHPGLPAGHRLCHHVLYRLSHATWKGIPRGRGD